MFHKHKITDKEVQFVLDRTDPDTGRYTGTEDALDEYRDLVLAGVKSGETDLLQIYADACYGGNNAFSEDWKSAEKAYLRLIDGTDTPLPYWYSSLGYIYYYGRTNGGIPDYDKAFQYFNTAAWAGFIEAKYKLSDMFLNGQGTLRSPSNALEILFDLYPVVQLHLEGEHFDCKFADVAIRLSRCLEEGVSIPKNPEMAYFFAFQAAFAIEKRKRFHFYGDDKVARRIQAALKRLEKELPDDYFSTCVTQRDPFIVGALLKSVHDMEIRFLKKGNDLFLMAKTNPAEDDPKNFLLTEPRLKLCTLAETVLMRVENPTYFQLADGGAPYYCNSISYHEEDGTWYFMDYDEAVAWLRCDGFSFEC